MLLNKERLFENDKSFIVTHNVKGSSLKGWEAQYNENNTYRKQKRKNSVFVTHELLSWHHRDAKNLTLKKMEAMTREYIKLRNPNGMYIAVPHFDKEHCHVHLCVSGVELKSGKVMRL